MATLKGPGWRELAIRQLRQLADQLESGEIRFHELQFESEEEELPPQDGFRCYQLAGAGFLGVKFERPSDAAASAGQG